MERDERGQATDGQADTTKAVGYTPGRDRMRAIVEALRDLQEILGHWQDHSGDPAYPEDFCTLQAIRTLFRLERAMRPRPRPWGDGMRPSVAVNAWDYKVHRALLWAANLHDIILERHELRWLAGATGEDFERHHRDPFRIPEHFLILAEELRSLAAILELLPDLDHLEAPSEQPAKAPVDTPRATAEPVGPAPALVLLGPQLGPIVLGKRKPLLSSKQFAVLKTLWDADGHAMTGEHLKSASSIPDAVNILRRIRAIDADYASILPRPGRGGRLYRVQAPDQTHKRPITNPQTIHKRSINQHT